MGLKLTWHNSCIKVFGLVSVLAVSVEGKLIPTSEMYEPTHASLTNHNLERDVLALVLLLLWYCNCCLILLIIIVIFFSFSGLLCILQLEKVIGTH